MQRLHTRQLYALSQKSYRFPNYVDGDSRLHTRPADGFPLMIWPDGSWCHPANTFMRELLEKGFSRRNRGGSLGVAAAHISHLIRYCWRRRCDLVDLTDNQFSEFIIGLQSQNRVRDPSQNQRDANSVIAIGRTCLALLECTARHAVDEGLLGPQGRIRAKRLQHTIKIGGGPQSSTKTVTYWDHSSFPNPDPLRKRIPIATANIEDMRKAVYSVSTTAHQRARRHTVLKLLEVTGARRGEIALIKTESLVRAETMEHPVLKIPTLKKRGETLKYRYVPISRADLSFISQYADVHRRSVVRRTLKGNHDHGVLLVNGRTGEPLEAGTITQEVRLLAKAAGIQEKACPHMFRHRFLTKLFVALIENHKIENKDDFRRLLLNSEQFKAKVAEWTDHASLDSLDDYIDLALDEIGNYKKIYSLANAGMVLDSFMGTIDAELDSVNAGEQPILILSRLKIYLEKLRADLADAKIASEGSVDSI